MTIRKRLFWYSFGVVSLVAVLILLYFTLMLSQLYARQIETDRVQTLKDIQTQQLKFHFLVKFKKERFKFF